MAFGETALRMNASGTIVPPAVRPRAASPVSVNIDIIIVIVPGDG